MRRILSLLLVCALHGCTIERGGQEAPSDTTDTATPLYETTDTLAARYDTTDSARSDTTYRIDRVLVPAPLRPPGSSIESARLLPVDEADEAPDFFAYRRRLTEAVSARDTSALYAMMSEDVHVSFGGDRGREDFREIWTPEREDSPVWRILGRVLGGGGLYEEGPFDVGRATARFTAPYTFAAFPHQVYDAFQHGVILDAAVRVHEEPRADAATLDTLSFAVVRVHSFSGPEEEWTHIELSGRRSGYVSTSSIASPVDYRALFHRIDGQWMMTALVAGD